MLRQGFLPRMSNNVVDVLKQAKVDKHLSPVKQPWEQVTICKQAVHRTLESLKLMRSVFLDGHVGTGWSPV